MICVFFAFPITGVQSAAFSPLESRAATAAGEVTNVVKWLKVHK